MGEPQGAMPPPPGTKPNFENPKDALNTVMIVTQALCMVFVTVFLVLRVWVRLKVLRVFEAEDYICVVSWILCVAYCVVALLMTKHGAGYNLWELTISTMTDFLKRAYAATVIYMPMAFSVKLALLVIIAKVFKPYKKAVCFIYVFVALLAGYYGSGLVVKARPCMPVSAYWHGDHSKCLDQQAIIIGDSVASVISDLIILVLPLPLTWSLQMDTMKKIRVMGILAAGGLATAFSIYRLVMIVQSGSSPNQTMVFARVVLSGNAEIGIGLICACLPALNALIGQRRQHNTSKKSFSRSREHELNKVSVTANGQNNTSTRDCEVESDKDYLVTNAQLDGEFETSVQGKFTAKGPWYEWGQQPGIVKTVDVSHAYERR